MAKASQAERQARAVCVELARVTGGRPMRWATVDSIMAGAGVPEAAADDAIALAAGRDWLLTEGQPPHSICLTDAGRIMAQQRARR